MCFADETDDYTSLLDCFAGIFDLEDSSLRGAVEDVLVGSWN